MCKIYAIPVYQVCIKIGHVSGLYPSGACIMGGAHMLIYGSQC